MRHNPGGLTKETQFTWVTNMSYFKHRRR